MLKAEHQLYRWRFALVAEGKARMEGGRTVFSGISDGAIDGLRFPRPRRSLRSVDVEHLARITP